MYEQVSVQPTGGVWGQIGADIAPGIYPESLTCSANEMGPDTASFLLKRKGSIPWNDLLPGAPVEITRRGLIGWYGRVEEVSADNGDGTQTVTCKGIQYHLDDDMVRPMFVHRSLVSGWKDWRTNLAATLANYTTNGQVDVGEGGIVFTHPVGANACGNMVYYDAGPGCLIKRVAISWAKAFTGNHALYLVSGNTLSSINLRTTQVTINNTVGANSGTYIYTLPTPARYVAIPIDSNGYARPGDESCRISAALLFGEVAYESAGDSAFTLDKLANFLLASGALPLLNSATDRIETFAFGIPELDPQRRITPRELLTAAQNLHDVRIQVDIDQKLVAELRPSVAAVEVGAWGQHEFRDGSTSRDPILSGAFAEGTDSAGEPLEVTGASTIATLPARQGYNKRNSMPIESALTTALATQLLTVYLANHQTAPFKGEQVVQGWGDLRGVSDGLPRHAFGMLRMTEELMRFSDRTDPDTGALGRDGRIKTVTYTADDERASIGIDNDSRKFEAIAARVAALNG